MGDVKWRGAAIAVVGLVLIAGDITVASAQDRRDALEALEKERLQSLRDAQARSAP